MEIDTKQLDKSGADPKIREVYRLLKKYAEQTARKEWIKKRNDCWDAVYETDDKSTIWTERERKAMEDKGMIPLVINDLIKGVQGSAAVITDQKPGIEFLPVGSGDLYVAELMRRAHDQVWAQNDGGSEAYEFVREAKVGGLAAFDSIHDPAKGIFGKLVFGNMDPTRLFYDMDKSRKPDLSDTPVLVAQLISKSAAKEKYEDLTDEDLAFDSGVSKEDLESGVKQDTVTGADNYTIGQKSGVPGEEGDEKEDIWEIEAHLLRRDREYWLMIPDQAGGWSRKVFEKGQKKEAQEAAAQIEGSTLWPRLVEKRVLRIVCGKKLIMQKDEQGKDVDEMVNPYGVDTDGDPVLRIVAMAPDRTRQGKPVSPTAFAKEACKERNKRRAQAIYVVSKNIDAPIASIGEIKWHKDPVHGDWLEVDKTSPSLPRRLQPGAVSTEALNMEAIAKQDVDDMYDMQDVMKGKIPSGDPSGRMILALQDMAGMMSKPFTRTFEAALVRLGKVNIGIILKTWTRQKWERLIEDEEKGTWVPEEERPQTGPMDMLGGNQQQQGPQPDAIAQKWQHALDLVRPSDPTQPPGISLIDIDVRVAAGSTMPTNRMGRAALAMEMVEKGIYDAEAALEYLDDPHKDKIIERRKAQQAAMMQADMMNNGKLPPGMGPGEGG